MGDDQVVGGPRRWPVETKVKAGARGAGMAGAVAGFVLWLLARYVFPDGVPDEVGALVFLVVPWALAAGASYVGGYLAPHTPRPLVDVKRSAGFPPPPY